MNGEGLRGDCLADLLHDTAVFLFVRGGSRGRGGWGEGEGEGEYC